MAMLVKLKSIMSSSHSDHNYYLTSGMSEFVEYTHSDILGEEA